MRFVIFHVVRPDEFAVCGRVEAESPDKATQDVIDAMIALEGVDALEGSLYGTCYEEDWDELIENGSLEENDEGNWVKTYLFDL